MMILVLQTLLVVSFSRSLPPSGEFQNAVDSENRRKLFGSAFDDAVDSVGKGMSSVGDELVGAAEETGAWAASTGQDALDATHGLAVIVVDEIDQHATAFANTMERAVEEGIEAFENIDIDELIEQIDSVLKSMCINVDEPPSCLLDIAVQGCMPGDDDCVITYGEHCLGFSKTIGGSMEMQYQYSESHRGIDLESGLSIYGGAYATVSSQAVVELHLNSSPFIRVLIEPPSLTLDAQVSISASASLTAEVEEKRIDIGPSILIYRRVFMAGYVPVVIAIRAQPVAFISASGELQGNGEITYFAKGTISFTDNLWIALYLDSFEAVQNFDTVTAPTVQFEEGWNFDVEANLDLQLTAKIGVEISFSLYDVVEINMLPMVVAQVSASGQISASGSGNLNSVDSLSAEASGLAELCLTGDFKGYLDWVDQSGNRKSGRGRRALMELEREQRRNLATIDLKEVIVDTCGEAVAAIAPGCIPAQEILRTFCGLAMEGLELLGFPVEINVPSIDQLALPSLDFPQTCFTMSLDWRGEMDFNKAQEEGIACGGHFHGSTVGLADNFGNPSGDAFHTFTAGDSHMVIDGCKSSYNSFFRLYRYERYTEEVCIWIPSISLDFPFASVETDEVCFDMPRTRWTEIASNDNHRGRCDNPAHGGASYLELNNLVEGGQYALVVEGRRHSEGQYSVSLSCPTLQASLVPQQICVEETLFTGHCAKSASARCDGTTCTQVQRRWRYSLAACKNRCRALSRCNYISYTRRNRGHCLMFDACPASKRYGDGSWGTFSQRVC